MTTVLSAGFTLVAETYGVSTPRVALTTGLYMMGLGLGSVIASPTAILFGKRPVYLVSGIIFILTAIWCALSPSYASLVVARIFMGLAVSPVECLPSATVAEIFFLHERAYRLGVYTLLLLGGKNLIPLVSAAIIESLGWRWVFYIVAMVVGFGLSLLFLFVPETFWDRTPRPYHWDQHHNKPRRPSLVNRISLPSLFRDGQHERHREANDPHPADMEKMMDLSTPGTGSGTLAQKRMAKRARFQDVDDDEDDARVATPSTKAASISDQDDEKAAPLQPTTHEAASTPREPENAPTPVEITPGVFITSPTPSPSPHQTAAAPPGVESGASDYFPPPPLSPTPSSTHSHTYTSYYRGLPAKSFLQTLKPFSGRLRKDNWFRVAARPFVLYAYPAILWSAMLYALSVGWLIVLSESVSTIYESRSTYDFTSLQAGLIFLSPFIGGVLGTAVAGKVSDLVVRWLSRRNGGIYEPEFRLVMTVPVMLSTVIGLMGYGWSAANRDHWIVPTVFFGVISFGCCLGSTTAITFAVDSYRQYAGEALVTLNFSKSEFCCFVFFLPFLPFLFFSFLLRLVLGLFLAKLMIYQKTDIFHGLVFSLFFNTWLDADGSKAVFLALGGIQLGCLLFTIPMYIYGKRARMWTIRRNLMEKL